MRVKWHIKRKFPPPPFVTSSRTFFAERGGGSLLSTIKMETEISTANINVRSNILYKTLKQYVATGYVRKVYRSL